MKYGIHTTIAALNVQRYMIVSSYVIGYMITINHLLVGPQKVVAGCEESAVRELP